MEDGHEMTMHEMLCAYVFGEADAGVVARVEAALESDPELRLEKERLERTVVAVREAVGAAADSGDQLVVMPAGRPVTTRWVAAAAALLLVAGPLALAWTLGIGGSEGELVVGEPVEVGRAGSRDENRGMHSAVVQRGEDGGVVAETEVTEELNQGSGRGSEALPIEESLSRKAGMDPAAHPAVPRDDRSGSAVGQDFDQDGRGAYQKNVKSVDDFFVESRTALLSGRSKIPVSIETPAGSSRGGGKSDFLRENQSLIRYVDRFDTARDSGVLFTDVNGFGQGVPGRVATLFSLRGEGLARGLERGEREVNMFGSDPRFRYARRPVSIEDLLASCRRRPNERPRDMYFRFWGDNPFVIARQDAIATFAADVDTASFVLARRYLRDGLLPERAQVRTEEFVNYFPPDLQAPTDGTFRVHTEFAPSPFGGAPSRWLVRVGLRAKVIPAEERAPIALTFVVDTSGSMKEDKRIELVKHSLRVLVSQLREDDRIGIVAFNNAARLVLPVTGGSSKDVIEAAVSSLGANGGTNAEAGLLLGYEIAMKGLRDAADGTAHRVVLLSDGVANIGETDQSEILKKVQENREAGICLNTVGVGMGNHNDVFLEQLADGGDGVCDYVDDARAVHRALVERFTGAFQPVARDVKIQVEFDKDAVLQWRQLGYENRVVADKDFRNDTVDAGEVGSGHQVTALFEIESTLDPAALKALDGALATVRVRWQQPGAKVPGAEATEIEHPIGAEALSERFDAASAGLQRAGVVAQFAEVLRRSTHATSDSWDKLVAETERVVVLPEFADDADTAELVTLLQAAERLGITREIQRSDIAKAVDEYRRHQYLSVQLECLENNESVLGELRSQNKALENRIRRLIENR